MENRTDAGWLKAAVGQIAGDERLDAAADKVMELAQPLTEGDAGALLQGRWLGHPLHPMLTDLAIGFFTSSMVLDLVGGKGSRTASRRLVGLGLLATLPTAAAGAADYAEGGDTHFRRVGVVHAIGNVVAASFYYRSWRSRRMDHHRRGVLWGLIGGGILTGTGYLGGSLVFGESTSNESEPETGTEGQSNQVVDLTGAARGDHLTIGEVAQLLGVSINDVEQMVQQEVLTPAGSNGEFRAADVEAVRLRGG